MATYTKQERVGNFYVNTFETGNITYAEVVSQSNVIVHTTGDCVSGKEARGLACRWIERHSD